MKSGSGRFHSGNGLFRSNSPWLEYEVIGKRRVELSILCCWGQVGRRSRNATRENVPHYSNGSLEKGKGEMGGLFFFFLQCGKTAQIWVGPIVGHGDVA